MAFTIPPALKRSPIRSAPIKPLLAPLLVLLLVVLLILTRDAFLEVPLLLSRCSSHAIHPAIGKSIPVLGSYICFGIAFFEAALESTRGVAFMSTVFAFTAALLTVTYIESSRVVAGEGGGYLRRLGLLWFLAHIGGGPFVFVFIAAGWIVTSYREIRRIRSAQTPAQPQEGDASPQRPSSEEDDDAASASAIHTKKRKALRRRRLRSSADALAIADAVLIGFALPAALALIYRSALPISLWLLFPIWVPLLRYLLATLVETLDTRRGATTGEEEAASPSQRSSGVKPLDIERSPLSLALVYAVPIVLSLAAHIALLWSLTRKDKSKAVTRSVLRYEFVNWGAIAIITLYSIFIEAGWSALIGTLGSSVLLGPGAGVCVGWILRERVIRREDEEDIDAAAARVEGSEGAAAEGASEATPLLRS